MVTKISAIIITRNRAVLLKRAVESVLSQSYTNVECIVVDDGSTDDTAFYCKSVPVKYIYIPPVESKGGNYARNLGIKAATGDYIAFLDDDDYWLPQKLEKQLDAAVQRNVDFVYCGYREEHIQKNGDVVYNDVLPISRHHGDMRKFILYSFCTNTSCIFVKTQLLNQIGLFDEKLCFWQEYELTIRLAKHSNFEFVNECLTVYRINAFDKQRLTNKYYDWLKAVDYIKEKHKTLFAKQSLLDRIKSKALFMGDAIGRCQNSGLYFKAICYKIGVFPLLVVRKVSNMLS